MKKFLAAAVVSLCIGYAAQAVTIKANFDPNMVFSRVSDPTSASLFYLNPNGYLQCNVQKKTGASSDGYGAVGYFSVPLDKRYYMPKDVNGVATSGDYYIGFDIQIDPASSGVFAAQIGLFNSDANNAPYQDTRINSVGTSVGSAVTGSFTMSVMSQRNDSTTGGTLTSSLAQVLNYSMATSGSYRCKMHIYFVNGQTVADFDLYTVDATGATVQAGTPVTGVVLCNATDFMTGGVNALGVRNAYSSSTTNKSIFLIDNMYFSTTGFQTMPAPSWLTPNTTGTVLANNLTYIETFRPFPGSWSTKGGGGSVFIDNVETTYYPPGAPSYVYTPVDGKGYGWARIRRKAEYDWSCALYQPLPTRVYMPYKDSNLNFFSSNEFWFGWDFKWQPSNGGVCYVFGLFNSNSSNAAYPMSIYNYQNHLGLAMTASSDSATPIVPVLSWHSKINPMSTTNKEGTVAFATPTVLTIESWYRFVAHCWVDVTAGQVKMELKAYKFDASGNLGTEAIMSDTQSVPTDVVFYEGMNAFGIRNLQTSSQGSNTKNDFNYDNAWFSTVSAAPSLTLGKPSWFALNRADGNVDGVVNYKDLKSFASEWMHSGPAFWDMSMTIPETHDEKVNVKDLAIFAYYWL